MAFYWLLTLHTKRELDCHFYYGKYQLFTQTKVFFKVWRCLQNCRYSVPLMQTIWYFFLLLFCIREKTIFSYAYPSDIFGYEKHKYSYNFVPADIVVSLNVRLLEVRGYIIPFSYFFYSSGILLYFWVQGDGEFPSWYIKEYKRSTVRWKCLFVRISLSK